MGKSAINSVFGNPFGNPDNEFGMVIHFPVSHLIYDFWSKQDFLVMTNIAMEHGPVERS